MALIKVRAKDNPDNVLEVDQSNADALLLRGTWELVSGDKDEKGDEDGNGSKPAGRRRAPRPGPAS